MQEINTFEALYLLVMSIIGQLPDLMISFGALGTTFKQVILVASLCLSVPIIDGAVDFVKWTRDKWLEHH